MSWCPTTILCRLTPRQWLLFLVVVDLLQGMILKCSSLMSPPQLPFRKVDKFSSLCSPSRTPRHTLLTNSRSTTITTTTTTLLVMKDRSSSYWFQVGDCVRVVSPDVQKSGVNLYHRVGKVMETWEKCDIDPTCCCAEQVDPNMAVRVEFIGKLSEDSEHTNETFDHYFAESELDKIVILDNKI
jgi:hypothetical protein